MHVLNVPGSSSEQIEKNAKRFEEFADRFRTDAAFRGQVEADGAHILPQYGFTIPPGTKVKVVTNTPSTQYMVFPPDPNTDLADEALDAVAGGATASTAGSMSTALSSCMVSSAGTAGCASTVG